MGLANSIKFYKKNTVIRVLNDLDITLKFLPNSMLYFLMKLRLIKLVDFSKYNDINLVISCGRVTAPINLIIKENSLCKNIHILDPYFRRKSFDKIVIPNHDSTKSFENSIKIHGSIVNEENKKIKPSLCLKLKKNLNISRNKKIITIFLGGNGKSSKFEIRDIKRFRQLISKIDNKKFQLFFLFSRRTPNILKSSIKKEYNKTAYIWDEKSLNPYWYLINNSDFFIITSDSISMTSDAISTSKPVFIFSVRNVKKKIKDFHKQLIDNRITREFAGNINSWNYNSISEGKRISNMLYKSLDL